jgi:hypothetical protein
MARNTSISDALRSFRERLSAEDIDIAAIGILMPRADFHRWRDEIRRESANEPLMETFAAFSYEGFTFLDSGSFLYARREQMH